MIADLVAANRSCRRFDETHAISAETVLALIELGRLCPSAANLQPLKYAYACTPNLNAQVFDCLKWAGYLETWPGPEPGQRPSAYIVVVQDTRISSKLDCDHGIAAQSIMLGAREKQLAGCMIASVNRPRLAKILNIPDYCEIRLVLAIGKPLEQVVLTQVADGGDIRYWRDAQGIHYVPKRSLHDIIIPREER